MVCQKTAQALESYVLYELLSPFPISMRQSGSSINDKIMMSVAKNYRQSWFLNASSLSLCRMQRQPNLILNKKRSSGKPFGTVYRNSAALGIAQVNLALLSFARAFFLCWRVNSSKIFSYSSAWLESASGNGDKRLTKQYN